MLSEAKEDGTKIIDEWRARVEAVIQAGRVSRLFTATVIHYAYRCSRRLLLHRVVRNIV